MLQAALEIINFPIAENFRYVKYNLILNKTYWLLLLGFLLNFNTDPVYAQNNISIDKDTVVQPLSIQGTSGGTITALEIAQTANTATGYCHGYVRSQPNHQLKLESFFGSLKLEVASPVDTTIIVKGPGGVWCNDDAGSANPVIKGQWQPGIYDVWVGSYQPGASDRYQIEITGK